MTATELYVDGQVKCDLSAKQEDAVGAPLL